MPRDTSNNAKVSPKMGTFFAKNPIRSFVHFGQTQNLLVRDDNLAFMVIKGNTFTLPKTSIMSCGATFPSIIDAPTEDSADRTEFLKAVLPGALTAENKLRSSMKHVSGFTITSECITAIGACIDNVPEVEQSAALKILKNRYHLALDENIAFIDYANKKTAPPVSDKVDKCYFSSAAGIARMLPGLMVGTTSIGSRNAHLLSGFIVKHILCLPDTLPARGSEEAKTLFHTHVMSSLCAVASEKISALPNQADGLPMPIVELNDCKDTIRRDMTEGIVPTRNEANGTLRIPDYVLCYSIRYENGAVPDANEFSEMLDDRRLYRLEGTMLTIVKAVATALCGDVSTWPPLLRHVVSSTPGENGNSGFDVLVHLEKVHVDRYTPIEDGDSPEDQEGKAKSAAKLAHRPPCNTWWKKNTDGNVDTYDGLLLASSPGDEALLLCQFIAASNLVCGDNTKSGFDKWFRVLKNDIVKILLVDGATSKSGIAGCYKVSVLGRRVRAVRDADEVGSEGETSARPAKRQTVSDIGSKLDALTDKVSELIELFKASNNPQGAIPAAPTANDAEMDE
jgi:hypothetical protein